MTIREGIHKVKRLFREINADSRLSDRVVYSLMNTHTGWLVYRESEKLKLVKGDKIYQTIKCVPVIEAPLIDPCCGVKSNCTIYRTKDRLPELFEDGNGVIIKTAVSIDSSTSLTMIKPEEYERKVNNPWINQEKKNQYFFFNDGYLYFPGGNWKKIEVKAMFKLELNLNDLCTETPDCDDPAKKCIRFLDTRFIIPTFLEAQMFDAVIRDLSNTYKRLPEKSNEINKNDN